MKNANYTQKKMSVKDVPKGVVFTDSEDNVFFRVADTKTDKGSVVLAYLVEAVTLNQERGDAAVLDPEQMVTAYFE